MPSPSRIRHILDFALSLSPDLRRRLRPFIASLIEAELAAVRSRRRRPPVISSAGADDDDDDFPLICDPLEESPADRWLFESEVLGLYDHRHFED